MSKSPVSEALVPVISPVTQVAGFLFKIKPPFRRKGVAT